MDPIAMGISVITGVVASLTGKLIEKAVDPENIAKGVSWVFSAVDNFVQIRKGKKSKGNPIPSPPAPVPQVEPPVQADDLEAESKAEAVKEIAQSLGQETRPSIHDTVCLTKMDDFAVEQLANQVRSLMSQTEIYLGNLRHEEVKVAQYGGPAFAPISVMNTIRIQQEEIAKRVQRLNKTMQQAYGVSAPDLDALTRAAQG